ncbi:hypothetical protein AB9P05_07980 [Roseivirga sp. BDSF3-8]|uniref:hypothetical protein n=1 Tax=Roseivirga sp. BDSF3-8 TaxID=3241598 RepID=UPI00353250AF
MSKVYDTIRKVKDRQIKLITAFSLPETIEKASQNRPDCIIIDDSFDKNEIERMVHKVANRKRTNNASFAILKTSNYRLVATNGIQEYLLKDDLSPEKLVRSILNAMRLKKTQALLIRTYRVNKRLMKRLIKKRKTRLGLAIENITRHLMPKREPARVS